jgi:aspartyl-tRNA(Asn)/glutamyl-tRNA(Gln) amidotransferase subunit A
MTALVELSITEAGRLIAERKLAPSELIEESLSQIAREEPRLEAFVTVCAEEARRDAAELTREASDGHIRGPLHGIPIGIKDLIDTAGTRTTSSSRVRADRIPDVNATVVTRLKAAGAVIIGKTNTHEFAYGPISAPTKNAWDQTRIAGGSSGGSAVAVAALMCAGAIGSDTGGSIRIPAAFNGVVGLKPTYGRVPKSGVTALSWSLDHVGPIARTVTDAALLLAAIAGRDRSDPTSAREPVGDYSAELESGVAGLRLGVPLNYFTESVESAVLDLVDTAASRLKSLGSRLVNVSIPELDKSAVVELGILLPEASSYHQADLRSLAELYGDDVRLLLELGHFYLATHYLNAQRARTLVKDGIRRCFEDNNLDALLVPATPMFPPRIGQETVKFPNAEEPVMSTLLRSCSPFNLSGQPVLTVPCGFSAEGVPAGLGIAGRPFAESTVLRIGRAYERTTDWASQRPPTTARTSA